MSRKSTYSTYSSLSSSSSSSRSSGRSGGSSKTLDIQKYFHGHLPREDIAGLLEKDGDFVLRTSYVQDQEILVLSVKWVGREVHFVIRETEDRRVYLEKKTFANIVDLISHYLQTKEMVGKSKVQLIRPVPRQEWQLTHEQITLINKVGEGEFGEVYKAYLRTGSRHDTRFQEVAVKLCRAHPSREVRMKFMHEARLLRIYNHPNIIQFIGVAAQETPLMIVTEFAPNGSLLQYVKQKGSTSPLAERLRFCLEASQGMEYLEKKTCIHQDLAARNCLLGKTNNIKIADFGLSQRQAKFVLKARRKQPIKWLAPEIILTKLYSSKSDVWAFGVLMWEVFSDGRGPYPDMSNQEAAKKVTFEKYRMPPPDGMPKTAVELMRLTWEHEADKRPDFTHIRKTLGKIYNKFK